MPSVETRYSPKSSPLQTAFLACKRAFLYAFLFSLAINILTLASPLYSLQVYDRVLSSGSMETLTVLSVIILVTFLFLGVLQFIRSMVFSQIGSWLDEKLSPLFLATSIRLSSSELTQPGSQI